MINIYYNFRSEDNMKLKLTRENVLLFLQYFIGFGCALFTVSYIFEGKISYIAILLTTLLFATAQTYRLIKKRTNDLKS